MDLIEGTLTKKKHFVNRDLVTPPSLNFSDFLSHYRLFTDPNTRYIATGGTISEKQKELIRTAFAEIHSQGGEINISTDNDEAGRAMARELVQLAPENARMKAQIPKNYKDWNEALQGQLRREREAREQERQKQQDRGFSL